MAEAVYTQLMDAVIERFESIEADGGATWWYTPDRVERHPAFLEEHLDGSIAGADTTLYVLVDRAEESADGTMGPTGYQFGVMAFDLVLAHAFQGPENAWTQPDPSRGVVQDRLLRDAKKALLKDYADAASTVFGLDGVVHGIELGDADRSAENTYYRTFALAFLPVRIKYRHLVSTP